MTLAPSLPAVSRLWHGQPTEPQSTDNVDSRRSGRTGAGTASPQTPIYGYHNTFHTHAAVAESDAPPSYEFATTVSTRKQCASVSSIEPDLEPIPPYLCTVQSEGVLAVKTEFTTPFEYARDRRWHDVYAVLCGTQLNLYDVKTPGLFRKERTPCPGRLLQSFTMQHAEVGVATDFRKTELTPRSPLAHLVPPSQRAKVYQTDPQLFEPVREFVFRVRVETQQMLFCCETQEQLLDWVESLCASVDIAPPLDDRSDPRYRSLPRRSRRPRNTLDTRSVDLANLNNMSPAGRRLIEEQERIIRTLYPNLAGNSTREPAPAHENETHSSSATPDNAVQHASDPEADDLDPADVSFPARRPPSEVSTSETAATPSTTPTATPTDSYRVTTTAPSNPETKHYPFEVHALSEGQCMRYRKRCAPILNATSPRTSDVCFSEGKRWRIDFKTKQLVPFECHPPRYDAHGFKKPDIATIPEDAALDSPSGSTVEDDHPTATATAAAIASRPSSRRTDTTSTDDSHRWSFGSTPDLSLQITPVSTNTFSSSSAEDHVDADAITSAAPGLPSSHHDEEEIETATTTVVVVGSHPSIKMMGAEMTRVESAFGAKLSRTNSEEDTAAATAAADRETDERAGSFAAVAGMGLVPF